MHVVGYIKNTLNYGITHSCDHDLNPSTFVMQTMGGVETFIALLLGMYSLWLEELSPGVVINDRQL